LVDWLVSESWGFNTAALGLVIFWPSCAAFQKRIVRFWAKYFLELFFSHLIANLGNSLKKL
jgi:hypothetical protein